MGVAAWALVISIVAATTGIASLVWQMASWRRNGPAIRVEAEVYKGRDTPIIVVNVNNRGRGDVGLQQAMLLYRAEGVSFSRDLSEALQLPRTVQGMHGGTWYAVLRRGDYQEDLKRHATIQMRLGSGKKINGPVKLGFFDYPTELLVRGFDLIDQLPQA